MCWSASILSCVGFIDPVSVGNESFEKLNPSIFPMLNGYERPGSNTALSGDEPSLGLAPLFIERVLDTIRSLTRHGIGVLHSKQNAFGAMSVATPSVILSRGAIVIEGVHNSDLEQNTIMDAHQQTIKVAEIVAPNA